MILELHGIYKDYQQGKMTVPVLKDVNFSMEEGEYVAIMGPSGSGKTTLMNIIGCLDQATKGEFILDGQDIRSCSCLLYTSKKAYLIEKNMPADKLLTILKQAEEERKNGIQVNLSIMKKNKKFQKEQMTAEGYTEFVEFFRDKL